MNLFQQTSNFTNYQANQVLNGITQKALANRLKVNRSSVIRNIRKGGEHFARWSAKYDPNGCSWERVIIDEQPIYQIKAD